METLSTEAYELGHGEDGVLLLHGFGGSPFELRPLAQVLSGRGLRCVAPLLPGHGDDSERMASVDERDWLSAASFALDRLRGCRRIAVVGFSMGGALAIRLAASRPVDVSTLVLLAPALALHGPSQLFRLLFRNRAIAALWPAVDKGPGDIAAPGVPMPPSRRIATRAAGPLDRTIREARRELPGVKAPALVLWGERDRVVPRAAAEVAAREIGSGPARLVVLPRSAHQLCLDYDRDRVAAEVGTFLERIFAVSAEEAAPITRQASGALQDG